MHIPFPDEARKRYYSMLDEVFDSGFWSEGAMQRKFENDFEAYTGLGARAVSNAGCGLYAALEYANVRGGEVVVPANTFWATARAAQMAGADVVFGDCGKNDLCLTLESIKENVSERTRAVVLVHIGGHLAFDSFKIAEFCNENGIALIEDCAHAHGAEWNGKMGGQFGLAGVYSFYSTKTMPTGEGGMVVSSDEDFLNWFSHFRNYGKKVENGKVSYVLKNGFNFRMNEMTAALGLLQLERLPEIVSWKRELAAKYDKIFDRRVRFPKGMSSGYYKYIVFDYPNLRQVTGQVFGRGDLGPSIMGYDCLPENSKWVSENHSCPPIWFGWEHADKSIDELKELLFKFVPEAEDE